MQFRRRSCSAWPQICFLHLAKTAGSSINQLLLSRFADHSGIGIPPEELDRQPHSALEDLAAVSAHFSLRHLPLLAPHRFLFTVLREPVDRVISTYYYFRAYTGCFDETNSAVLTSSKTKSLHQFLCDDHPQVRSYTHNLQANALAWDWRSVGRQPAPDLGEIAIRALEHFDFIGLFECYDESLEALFRQLHWQLQPHEKTRVVNKTEGRPRAEEIAPATVSLIRELNRADQQLYDFVAARWEGKRGAVLSSVG